MTEHRATAGEHTTMDGWLARRLDTIARLGKVFLAPLVSVHLHRSVEPPAPHTKRLHVFERGGRSDRWIADQAMIGDSHRAYGAPMVMRGGGSLAARRSAERTFMIRLEELVKAHHADPALDVELVPVSVFVGRAPSRTRGWFAVLFSESWAMAGPVRRLMAVLLNGRDTHVHVTTGISVRRLCDDAGSQAKAVRKIGRLLRVRFRNVRTGAIGPDLSTRGMLIDQVVTSPAIRHAIREQARRNGGTQEDATKQAFGFAREIAADYSHSVVRSLSFLLAPVWNRVYRGVTVNNLDRFREAARGHEVIYVPCHRSHMDYLLLSYLLYQHAIVPPHIAAGVNLNLPVVGSILRRCGAFYLRRNVKGSPLYSAVFAEYMGQLIARGHSIEYFIEGGRSRTGRLQPPKGGTLSMTVRAFLRQRAKPVLFQPVYIGYERIIEGASYTAELSGKPKQGETIWQLLSSIPRLFRTNFGHVTVNFGEPIHLGALLDGIAPGWETDPQRDERPTWLTPAVDELARRINVNVNGAADANAVNLMATALLSAPAHAIGERDLLTQLSVLTRVLKEAPYGEGVTLTSLTPAHLIARCEVLGMIKRTPHPFGDVIGASADQAVLLSYYRNNMLHLFVPAALVAAHLMAQPTTSVVALQRLGRDIYPFIRDELFLSWEEPAFDEQLTKAVDVLSACDLITRDGDRLAISGDSDEVMFVLRGLGHAMHQTFERYYIAASILTRHGSGVLSSARLESLCHLAAQRLVLLHGMAAPEFFDKALFRGFVQGLRSRGLTSVDESGNLAFGDGLVAWARHASRMLSSDLRHAIDRISPGAMT
ncbi:glycerol-3-phosphate 1-O-acyltransferase PlsB [Luteibacter aegosomatis]|uniref:glycerol-3-phosphate 1-O-acyltransferase PlsB n=1 Tax=Luteibacter aegosomatis TaxID=2911537 RepID=UPI001FF9C7BB|nr:glycerol-3-phosphate 1-O-acyltransferase PlsB [Luteibacter aegosomatis]UPG85812.1 glycerol-3-phosphate 1-O-acyltransferase PlsB [Luteibacter aegosomatis]